MEGRSKDADTVLDNNVITASPRLSSKIVRNNTAIENGGLVGLRNLGNTCFMNSVLQCLSNTRPLLEYILGDNYSSDINTTNSSMKGALIKAFSTVIQELWGYPEGSSSLSPAVNTTALKSQLQRFAPRFTGYSQQDAQEFLRYLLEGLHEDVNRVVTKPASRPILPEVDPSLSDNQKAMEAWKRYLRLDNSKIVDIFVGQLKSTLKCTVCGHCSVTFDPFWDLSLPIPSRTGQVRLQQCFDLFTKEEVLDGDEKPTCSKCQVRRKCTKSFSIQKFPRILVLHLKRFSPMERFRGKLNCTVDFPLSGLDLSAYAASRGQGCVYNAYGVANHSGTTYSGHYTAYCKHPYNGDWHEYNDSRVSTVSPRNVVTNEAYVLFYELLAGSPSSSGRASSASGSEDYSERGCRRLAYESMPDHLVFHALEEDFNFNWHSDHQTPPTVQDAYLNFCIVSLELKTHKNMSNQSCLRAVNSVLVFIHESQFYGMKTFFGRLA
ncbi:hypothetical protein J437_LFUL007721 [Ladona fulva]|uniref:ubiquitinyl hydrolase 1 n=1 Tax=Ladona fulva TaxID=123851 RepID=A0A8K0K2F7_LADFU|nr:hypothetical protein J437_LFUL007721 [Ladona fulva]